MPDLRVLLSRFLRKLDPLIIFYSLCIIILYSSLFIALSSQNNPLLSLKNTIQNSPTATPTVTPVVTTPTTTPTPNIKPVIKAPTPTIEWGKALQIGEKTWTINVGMDERMATPQEIFEALNSYRQRYSRGTLTWDNKLAEYAQSRANTFISLGKTDAHAGFSNFIDNEDGFNKLEMNGLGENSSFGYRLLGVHLIEWVYAADEPHNTNQLNSKWTHVGIGVSGDATDLIFGYR